LPGKTAPLEMTSSAAGEKLLLVLDDGAAGCPGFWSYRIT
jgi:hypothetical protein